MSYISNRGEQSTQTEIDLLTALNNVTPGNTNQYLMKTGDTEFTVVTFVDTETPSGDKNGSNTDYTIANDPISGSLKVYRNGIRQILSSDYTYDSGTQTITYTIPLQSVENHEVDYRYV